MEASAGTACWYSSSVIGTVLGSVSVNRTAPRERRCCWRCGVG
jgi:hypothetical protein